MKDSYDVAARRSLENNMVDLDLLRFQLDEALEFYAVSSAR